ncbi:hypothetical protein EV426DRAFT_720453 [Tirmania nivea]|nr:hypothetical protein EV426DRAFT_720453 [Tirmania nivea]
MSPFGRVLKEKSSNCIITGFDPLPSDEPVPSEGKLLESQKGIGAKRVAGEESRRSGEFNYRSGRVGGGSNEGRMMIIDLREKETNAEKERGIEFLGKAVGRKQEQEEGDIVGDRHALSAYTWLRTNRGPQNYWLHFVRRVDSPTCPNCDHPSEDGYHITFDCPHHRQQRQELIGDARTWEDLDTPIWRKEEGEEGEEEEWDAVEAYFTYLYCSLAGR